MAARVFPTRRIGKAALPRLILGHMPFVGESYQGQGKNSEYAARFSDVRNTVKILKLVVEKFGITVLSVGAMGGGALELLLLEAVKEAERATGTRIGVIPCAQLPLTISGKPVDACRRWLTYYEAELRACGDLERKYLEDPVLQCREGWKREFGSALRNSKPYGADEVETLRVEVEKLDRALLPLEGFEVLFVELGSESDFLALTGRTDLLAEAADRVLEKFEGVLLGIHHAGTSIPILEKSDVRFEGYVTPVNRLGVMMFPTADEALRSIRGARKPAIAIKPLAGGRIGPRSAFQYVYAEAGMAFSMVGVGSEEEAEEDLSIAAEIVGG
ncbi:MAG: hypothetical protein QXF24_03345 [Thermoproteota archaeon]